MSHIIEFVIFEGALGLDITGPLEVFSTASVIIEQKKVDGAKYKARFVAENKGIVRLSSGLEVVANADFSETSPADTLFIPGGDDIDKCPLPSSGRKIIGISSEL